MTSATSDYRHTDQPVWRSSYDVGDARAQVFRPIADGTNAAALTFIEEFIKTMKAWADESKPDGKAHHLTQNAVHCLERMLRRCTDFKTGRCEPSINRIMEVTRYSRATVIKLLARLRGLGFVEWVRRTERTGNRPGDGPMVRQASNAYFFEISRLPKKAQMDLRQRLRRRGAAAIEHPDRAGSGCVPNMGQRRVSKLVRGLAYAFGGDRSRRRIDLDAKQAEFRAQEAAFDAATADQRGALLFPGNALAQAKYEEEMAHLRPAPSASLESAPESPP